MKAKIVEILQIILEEMHESKSLEDINLSLAKEMDKDAVNVAFSLLFDKIIYKREYMESGDNNSSFRVASEEEILNMGVNNYNYLLYLFNLGIFDNEDFNVIMEQIDFYPRSVLTREDINLIVLFSLMDDAEMIPGSRFFLNTSDKIN